MFAGAEIPQVVFVQCKFEEKELPHKQEKKELIEFANKMLAIPVWARRAEHGCENLPIHKGIILINLLNDRLFIV